MRALLCVLVTTLISAACLIEVPKILSCGDGYVDRYAGEECDPAADLHSFAAEAHDACVQLGLPAGAASCDPVDCRLRADVTICSVCGDGKVTGGERCEPGGEMPYQCPDGAPAHCDPATCQPVYDHCGTCLNGQLDPNEECDPSVPLAPGEEEFTSPIHCAGLDVTAAFDYSKLQPEVPGSEWRYTAGSGSIVDCSNTCRLDRSRCSFCGDGALDQSYQDYNFFDDHVPMPAEQCEVGILTTHTSERCKEACGLINYDKMVDCNYECDAHCREAFVDLEDPNCCLPAGELCSPTPVLGEPMCCSASIDGNPTNGCGVFQTETGEQEYRCVSGP